ncbi:Cytochrome P450 3A4 [Rhizophlyctis rosea]|nr:Cytochrome P450 3A4 [Rhizophlyctis rosea]
MTVLSTLSNVDLPALPTYLQSLLATNIKLPYALTSITSSDTISLSTLLLSTSAAALLTYAFFGPRSKNPTVPGAYELPIFGNFLQAYPYIRNHQFNELTEQWVAKYGNIVSLKFFQRQVIITRDPDVAKRVLNPSTTDPEFKRPDNSKIFVIPYMLFALGTDDLWKSHRKFLQPAFGPSHLRYALDVSNEVLDELEERWDDILKQKGGEFRTNMKDVMTSVTMDIIGKVAFSYNFNAIQTLTTTGTFHSSIDVILKTISERFAVPPPLWRFFGLADSSPAVKQAREANEKLLKTVIAQKKKEGRKDERGFDLLDRLMVENESGGEGAGKFSEEEILGEVWGFFMAGHETTSHTLTFIFLELCRNPHILAKLVEEIDTVLPRNAKPTWDSLPQLKYLDQIIKETQRLWAVVGGVGRETTRDVELLGHKLQKGTRVNITIRQLQRDARYWDDPLSFIPERWDNGFVPRPGTFLPFGDGPHNCIGQKMAIIETKVAVVRVVQRFSVRMLEGQSLVCQTSVTTGLKDGLVVDVRRRV